MTLARDPVRLGVAPVDLLVVGGGVHGLIAAYDAAARGLSVALVERGDFGSGASFNHQKTAHGGLRSLGGLRLRHARMAIRERRALARIAPHLLRPIPFLVGTYRSVSKGRLALRAGFKLDAWLGRHRNDGIEPELRLPPARLVSRTATLKLFPGIRDAGLTGGATWYDYQMVEADRLTIGFALAAARKGAILANYVEAIGVLRQDGRVAGMRVRDRLTGAEHEVLARVVLNAAGGEAGQVMRLFGDERPFPLLKALNVVTRRPAGDLALAAQAPTGRMLTMTPWRGRALVGTWQSPAFANPQDAGVSADELRACLADVNAAFPALHVTPADVTLVHRGLVPAVEGRRGPELRARHAVIDHASNGAPGALTLVGVKYTTARLAAERAVDRVMRLAGRSAGRSTTARETLPGAGIADHEALAIETGRAVGVELDPVVRSHLVATYAERCAPIIRLMGERRDLISRVSDRMPVTAAEIVHAIRAESAVRLSDVVMRRTPLGSMEYPGDDAIERVAANAAAELGWDSARTDEEIRLLRACYPTGP
ncbi:MAG TPA: FAD-dependent oxidoreductase [Vicinamibacterales bacterium]|jgi:glycerol-3-phosphate dehydrogenase|nr:FAD-dependent oxidoreductase [Vicinamibacterales bacterium]